MIFVTESIAVRRRVRPGKTILSFAVVRLAALQATGFIGLEALERLSGGEHHFATALLTEPATLFGLALQLLSALTAALMWACSPGRISRVASTLFSV
ncbi:MAG: hypothetical protein ACR2I4_10180 [Actinomycetota bacterium]